MRDSATPTRDAPLHRLAFLGLVFVAAILSCAKDVTGPNGASRFMRGFSWNPIFPPALRSAGGLSSGVVDFNRVHVVLYHSDGTTALDTTIAFPSTADSVTVSLTVPLLTDAPASGEPMTVDLGYLDAAGDTVFKGGPISLTAAPAPAGGGKNPPVQVPVAYTGPGAAATSVAITPHTSTAVAGAGFTLTAIAKDAGGNALAGTPVVWISLDTTIAKITAPAAGVGIAQSIRGTARIVAMLLTGAADTAQMLVSLPASQIAKPAAASGDAQTGTAGTALTQAIVAKVAASDGVGVAGTTVTFAVATGGGSVSPLTAVSDANGLAQTTWTLGTASGAQSVTATAATLTGSPLTYTATATAAAATKLVVTTQPANATGGALMPAIVVSAEDANGNVATTFTGAVTLVFGTTTSGATLGGTATVNAVAGVATFPTLTINTAFAGYTLVASAGGLTGATTNAFSIATGAAATISTVGGNAQTGTVSVALPTPISVHVTDAGGNSVAGKTVVFATTNGSVSPASAVSDASGLAVTTWTLGTTAGAQSMTATATGLINSPLTVTATGAAVAATKLVFTTAPVTTSGGATLAVVAVSAEDASGNVAATFTGAVTLAFGNTTSGATLGGTTTVAAVAGVATFSTLTIDKAFTGYTLVASATGPTSATSPGFDITTGLATTITTVGGNLQTGTINVALPTPISARVSDAGGNGVAGKTVTFATANGSVSPTSAVSDASGLAVTTWTLGATVGAQSMTATAAGLTNSPLSITATGTAAVAGPATTLSFTTQPSNVAAGASIAPAMVVHALDANGLLATSFSGNVVLTIGTNPGASALGGSLVLPAVAGVVTFSNAIMSKVGIGYTLVASSGTLTVGTSATFNVTPGPAFLMTIAAGNGQTAAAGTAVATAPEVTVTDAEGNPVSGTNVTFAVAGGGGSVTPLNVSTNAAGQAFVTSWTLGTVAGAQTLVAASAGLTGSPATFTATAFVAGLRTWTGASNTAWTNAANWSPSGVPASTDSVVVPFVTNLPTLASSATIKALTLAPSAVLTISGAPLTITGSLDATGGIVGTGGVSLNSATGAVLKGTIVQSLQVAGLYTVTGTLSAGGLQVTNSGSVDINGQTVAIGTSGISTASTATIVMTQAAGVLGTTGGASFGGGDETGKLTAGTLSVGGNFSEGGGNSGAFNAGPAHTLVLTSTVASTMSMFDPATSQIGNLTLTGAAGVTALTAFIANNVTITTGVFTGTLGATINGTLTDPLAHWAAGNISFATSSTPVSASTPSITPAAQVTFNNNPSNLAGNLTINGVVNVLGNVVANGHTLTINGAFATAGANGQLTMTNAADVVNVTGNVTFGSTNTGGSMTAGTLNIGGNFLQQGSPQSITTGGTNTLVFNGTGTQTVIFSAPDGNFANGACVGTACVQNLTVNKTAGNLNFLTTTKVQGNFVNSSTTPVQTPVSNGAFIVVGNATFGQNGNFFHVGVGGTTVSKGAGTTIDSVTYFGTGQAFAPATLGENYADIRGTSSWTAPGTLTGQMLVDGNGQLNVATSAVVTGNFTTSGSGTLKMTTNLTDTLAIGGNAMFGGGATSGLLTTGNIVIGGSTVTNTGLAFDASGAQTTTFNATSGTQTLNWTSPVAAKGYNNITLRGAAQRQFGGPQTVVGNMLIGATSGNVNGSFVLTFGGNITDSTAGRNAWNGSSVAVLTGTPTVLPRNFGVNTVKFSGGTVTLADSLKTGFVVVDGATAHLKLNGHYVGLTADFTTQNGGVLEMTNTRDTLDIAGQATFNGGSTAGLLTHGFINVGSPGFTQGVNAAAFSADSTLRTSIGRGNGTNITFANPGFGSSLSHFGELMIGDGSTHTLNSDVYVQGQLTTTTGPQFPVTSTNHLITAQGANATHLFLTNTRLLLVDGSPISTLTDLRFSSMDPTVTQLEIQRSGTAGTGDFAATLSAPVFNTTPSSGLYLKATDTNGSAPFLTINVSSPTPAVSATFASVLSGAIINGWTSTLSETWLGVSSLWNSTSNWSAGIVPTATTDVTISCDCSAPQTSTASAVHNLTITNGNQLSLGTSAPLTVNGDLSVSSNSDINVGSASVTLLGNVSMDPTASPAGVFCGTGSTGAILAGAAAQNVTGKFCRLAVASNVVATGAIVVKNNNAGAAGLTVQSGGNINFNGQRVETDSMYTTGTGTIAMTHAADSLVIHGANVGIPVFFNGGSTTGLITNGTVVDRSPGFQVTGTAFDAANGSNTLVADTAASQSFKWIGGTPGQGLNNVLLKSSSKNFSSDLVVNGTLTLDASMTPSGAFQATGFNLYAGQAVDNTGSSTGGFSGAYWLHLTQSGAAPALLPVDSLFFESGGNMQLTNNVTTNAVVVVRPDVQFGSNTGLLLNGHRLKTANRNFITTGTAFLGMLNAADSLDVGTGSVFFNGGDGFTTAQTAGGIAAGGFYQGYINTTTLASGTAPDSYNPTGTHRLWLTQNAPIIFANPGTGASLSHFNTLHNPGGFTTTFYSDVFVDDSIYFATGGTAIFNSDQPSVAGKTRLITTQGLADNTTSTGIEFNNVALKWVDGRTAPTHFDNVQWTGFPLLYPGTVFEVNRSSSAAPTFDSHNFVALLVSGLLAGGNYVLNSSPSTGPTLNFTNTLGLVDFILTFGQHSP